jgi:hypothetical protein
MSKEKEKAQRYGGLAAIRQPGASATAAPDLAQSDKPEPFSSHLTTVTKRRLKQAAAKEGRKQFETLEQAVLEYLAAYHPDIQ